VRFITMILAGNAAVSNSLAIPQDNNDYIAGLRSRTSNPFPGTSCEPFDLYEVTANGERHSATLKYVELMIIGEEHIHRDKVNKCILYLAQALPQFVDSNHYNVVVEQPLDNFTKEQVNGSPWASLCDQESRVCNGWDLTDSRLQTTQILVDYKESLVQGLIYTIVTQGNPSIEKMNKRVQNKKINQKIMKAIEEFLPYLGQMGDDINSIINDRISYFRNLSYRANGKFDFVLNKKRRFDFMQSKVFAGLFEASTMEEWLENPQAHWVDDAGNPSLFKEAINELVFSRNKGLIDKAISTRKPAFITTSAHHMYEGPEVPDKLKVAPSLNRARIKYAYLQLTDPQRGEESTPDKRMEL